MILGLWMPAFVNFFLSFNSITTTTYSPNDDIWTFCLIIASTNIAFAILFWIIIHAHSKPIKPFFNNIPLWGLFISSSNVISFLTTKPPTHYVLIEAYGVVSYVTFSLSITLALFSTKYSLNNIPRGFRGLGWAVIIIFNYVTVVLAVYVMMFISVTV
ncbi:hypothetical protein QJS04_geneDACA024142 [Acorus gramineus]|uniref:NADH dehydrogenase subunit 6 n=1 Tax=Acorus gramineus TaxID=55184 RepID=A0AAV9BX96_ACOGR|nr:hypothetical protein QJS04_geneDACA024142 [Acorus gramineus]